MKNFICCLSIAFLNTGLLLAQESVPLLRYKFQDTVRVFGENVNLRADTNVTATVIERLQIGEQVVILGQSTRPFVLKERTEYWYKVKTLNQPKEGYIWGGLLSCVSAESGDLLFLMNKVAVPNQKTTTMEIRAVQDQKLLHTINVPDFPFESTPNGEYYLTGIVNDNRGLSEYKHIVHFTSTLETGMCDVKGATLMLYLLWDGQKMKPLPIINAEGGCIFGSFSGASYIFPSDPEGVPDLILHRSVEGECDEDEIEYTKTIRVRKFN